MTEPLIYSPAADIEGVEFCSYPRHSTVLSAWESLTLSDSGEVGRAIKMLAKRLSALVLNRGSVDDALGVDALGALKFYSGLSAKKQHRRFFTKPARVPQVTISAPHPLSKGEVFDITFRSGFTPQFEPFRDEFLSYQENKTVHARVWQHPPGESLGCVVAIHGWFMGDQRINALALFPGFFFRLGLDVVLFELPYHGRRAPANGNSAKAFFPSMHIARTNEAIAQAIYDLRLLKNWIQRDRNVPIGVVGMSLGGYVAALWASLDRLSFAIPLVPMVSMEEIGWRIIQEAGEDGGTLAGGVWDELSQETLKNIFAIHCPLNYQPKLARNRRMIIASRSDNIIPASQPETLCKHWNHPQTHWFAGGHLSDLTESKTFEELHLFLKKLRLAHPEMLPIKGE